MVSLGFIFGLLSIISFFNAIVAVKPVDGWQDRLCLNYANANGVPPGDPEGCSVSNQTCVCEQGQWRSFLSTCIRVGDHRVPGCVNEKSEIVEGVLNWFSDYFCPTLNGTVDRPDYSSWSFPPATTAFTDIHASWTSRYPHSTSNIASTTSSAPMVSSTPSIASSFLASPSATTSSTPLMAGSTLASPNSALEDPTMTAAPTTVTTWVEPKVTVTVAADGGSLTCFVSIVLVVFWGLAYVA